MLQTITQSDFVLSYITLHTVYTNTPSSEEPGGLLPVGSRREATERTCTTPVTVYNWPGASPFDKEENENGKKYTQLTMQSPTITV